MQQRSVTNVASGGGGRAEFVTNDAIVGEGLEKNF